MGVVMVVVLAVWAGCVSRRSSVRVAPRLPGGPVGWVVGGQRGWGGVRVRVRHLQFTLWTRRDYAAGGVAGLVRARTRPKGPIKLTGALQGRIVELDTAGGTLASIAAQTGVSTATVRVALGRVWHATEPAGEPDGAATVVDEGESVSVGDAGRGGLVVLAQPAPRTAERVAARFGELVEAPVVITQGAQLPQVGVLLGLPALEATGLLQVAEGVYGPMRNGFCGLRVTLLMGVFLALLRERRAEGATQLPPTDLHKATRALFESGLKNLNPFPALQCRTHQSMKSHDNPHPPLNVGTTLLENRCLSPGHC